MSSVHFITTCTVLCLALTRIAFGQIADLLPTSNNSTKNVFDKVLVSLDTDCITHLSSKQKVFEVAESIVSQLNCVDFWFNNQLYKETSELIFFVPNQTLTHSNTKTFYYDESYFYIQSKNNTNPNLSLINCLTNNLINWNDSCIITTEFDIFLNGTFSIEQDCTPQTVNDLTFEWWADTPTGTPSDGYLEYLDLLNINSLETISLENLNNGINHIFSYKQVTDNDSFVDIYVIDTGVECQHIEFDDLPICESLHDDNTTASEEHGTAVASSLVGKTVGIARGFPLYWYNMGETLSEINIGLQMIRDNIISRGNRSSIINLSFGHMPGELGEDGQKRYDARFKEIKNINGIIFAAAGNDNAHACAGSAGFLSIYPCASPHTICVGNYQYDGETERIERNPNSNRGDCVEIFGPGTNVTVALGASIGNFYYYDTSGTSLASPIVAGIAAVYLAESIRDDGNASELVGNTSTENMLALLQSDGYTWDTCVFQTICYAAKYPDCPTQAPTSVPTAVEEDDTEWSDIEWQDIIDWLSPAGLSVLVIGLILIFIILCALGYRARKSNKKKSGKEKTKENMEKTAQMEITGI